MFLLVFWAFLLQRVVSFNAHQARMARKVMRKRSCVPQFARIVDAVLKDQIAFALADGNTVYVDGARLEDSPNTFHNVIVHETSHLCGSKHGDGTLAMEYHVTTSFNGSVQDDGRRIAVLE